MKRYCIYCRKINDRENRIYCLDCQKKANVIKSRRWQIKNPEKVKQYHDKYIVRGSKKKK